MPPLHDQSISATTSSPGSRAREFRRHDRGDSFSSSSGTSVSSNSSAQPSTTPEVQRGSKNPQVDDLKTTSRESHRESCSDPTTERTLLLTSRDIGSGFTNHKGGKAVLPNRDRSGNRTSGGWAALQFWFCSILLPLGGLVWCLTSSIILMVLGMLSVPLIAILQGSIAIYRYRANFGDCPLPMVPSHGVVRVVNKSTNLVESSEATENTSPTPNNDTPIRLLVIGDSLAIGVGQSKCCTPVMPETIAKSLSKEMGGHPVQWICHGAPGASAGWIVRELESTIARGKSQGSLDSQLEYDPHADFGLPGVKDGIIATGELASVTDENSNISSDNISSGGFGKVDLHRFDPNTVGPFDIAVVLTGSNDLKSAFFPFLLQGDDVQFRHEAKQHGGGYGKELARILQVLNRTMRKQLDSMRGSIEDAKQSIRHCLGTSDDGNQREPDISDMKSESSISPESFSYDSKFPIVVLPGMPSRVLPIFSVAPLRWLAVPIIDIMDAHKRKLASHRNEEVLFVEAPTAPQMVEYLNEQGEYWEDEQNEQVVLRQRNIKDGHARSIEFEMKNYYSLKRNQRVSCRHHRHFDVVSMDGIHPNDAGYRFWGRHIARHIIQEWKSSEKRN